MKKIRFDPVVKLGDLLTCLSVLLSVVALLLAWNKDRQTNQREHANRVRTAAAKTLLKLDRWKEVSLSVFDEAKPIFVQTKMKLADDFEVIKARDFMWKGLQEIRLTTQRRLLDEQIELSYVDLYAYRPKLRTLFLQALEQLRAAENDAFHTFAGKCEDDVLSWADKKAEFTTGQLWRQLNETSNSSKASYVARMKNILLPVDDFLFTLISKSDADVLRLDYRPTQLPASSSKNR